MKRHFLTALTVMTLTLLAATARAQSAPTFLITDTTGRLTATASPEHNATFAGSPVLTSYVIDYFLKASITNFTTCVSNPVAPVVSVDRGKPTPNAQNVVDFGLIKPNSPTLVANTEYYACARAVGPGGSSPRSAVAQDSSGAFVPFGFSGAPTAPGSPKVTP